MGFEVGQVWIYRGDPKETHRAFDEGTRIELTGFTGDKDIVKRMPKNYDLDVHGLWATIVGSKGQAAEQVFPSELVSEEEAAQPPARPLIGRELTMAELDKVDLENAKPGGDLDPETVAEIEAAMKRPSAEERGIDPIDLLEESPTAIGQLPVEVPLDDHIQQQIQAAGDALASLKDLVGKSNDLMYDIGGTLRYIEGKKLYLTEGHDDKRSFANYLKTDVEAIGIGYRRAMYAMEIYEVFKHAEKSGALKKAGLSGRAAVQAIGWAKASDIARLRNRENGTALLERDISKLVEMAKDTPRSKFSTLMREYDLPKLTTDQEQNQVRLLAYRMPQRRRASIQGVIDELIGAEVFGTKDPGEVLEKIIDDWMLHRRTAMVSPARGPVRARAKR